VEDGKLYWMSGVVFIGPSMNVKVYSPFLRKFPPTAVYVLIAPSFWHFPETVRTLQSKALVFT